MLGVEGARARAGRPAPAAQRPGRAVPAGPGRRGHGAGPGRGRRLAGVVVAAVMVEVGAARLVGLPHLAVVPRT